MIIKTKIFDLTDIFYNTSSKLISENIKKGKKVFGIKLEKMKGLLKFEIQPNRRIGTELADLAKRFGLNGLIHSDELPKYGINEDEIRKVYEKIGGDANEDAFIIIIDFDYNHAKIVFLNIIERLNSLIKGVPKDTRNANPDGTSSFLRPQPGSARMYPETDLPYIILDRKEYEDKIVYKIKMGDKEDVFEILKTEDIDFYVKNKDKYLFLNILDPEFRKKILKYIGFNDKQIEDILWSEYLSNIEDLGIKYKDPNIIYYLFFQLKSDIQKEYNEEIEINIEILEKILKLYKENKITRDALKIIYYESVKNNKEPEEILEEKKLYKINDENILKEMILDFIQKNNIDIKKDTKKIFEKFKIIADGALINKILKEL